MKQSYHRYAGSSQAPSLFLTPDDVLLLNKALPPLERLIVTSPKSLPNIHLAQETLRQVQAKVACMIEHPADVITLLFTDNEVIILHMAVRWFLLNGEGQPDSPGTYEALKHSLLLQSKLALLAARTKRKL